ncbi:MAG: fibronectin type III domain-containing protein [Acidobacteria bacterium]|nr:fibronectin type III domain-containing protein [Acidobacteriota bacterium]
MKRANRAGIAILLVLMLSCQEIQSDPPEMTGQPTVRAINDTQLLIAWPEGSDDFQDAHELRYAVWLARSNAELEPSNPPTTLTQEGQNAVVLNGLEPKTEYQVLVRVRDRADQDSENETTVLATTLDTGQGPQRLDFALPEELVDLGRFVRRSIGPQVLLLSEKKVWAWSGDAALGDANLILSESLSSFKALPVPDKGYDDLLLSGSSGIRLVTQNDVGRLVSNSILLDLDLAPDQWTCADWDADGWQDLAVIRNNEIQLYQRPDSQTLELQSFYGISGLRGVWSAQLVAGAHDLVVWADQLYWMAQDSDFEFVAPDSIALPDDIGTIQSVLVANFDADPLDEMVVITNKNDRQSWLVLVDDESQNFQTFTYPLAGKPLERWSLGSGLLASAEDHVLLWNSPHAWPPETGLWSGDSADLIAQITLDQQSLTLIVLNDPKTLITYH